MGVGFSSIKGFKMKKIAIVLGCFLVAQIFLLQQFRINNLTERLIVSEKSKEIEKDQSDDLAYQLYQIKMQIQHDSIKDFVSGVGSVIKNPSYYEQIWHDGYDRGVSVQKEQEKFIYTVEK